MSTDTLRIAQNALSNENDLIGIRSRTKQLAALCELGLQEQTRLVTAVSEVARNALLYADNGRVEFDITGGLSNQFLRITILDKGPGLPESSTNDEVGKAIGKNSSLVAIKKLVDHVEITSTTSGTRVVLKKRLVTYVGTRKAQEWQKALHSEEPNTILQDLQDQNKQLVTLLDDVQKFQAELEERTKQLQQANELKAQFLANVSHEIRTPMGAIIGLANILTKRTKDPEDRRLLDLLNESASSLLTMINDILDISKIDEGKLAIESQNFSLPQLLENVAAVFSNEADKRGLTIIHHCADEIPQQLLGDTNRIRQILINLIGNALKFSDRGTINLLAELSWSGEDRVGVVISVTDRGIGINDSDLVTLFDPFSQLSDAAVRKVGGTGLGLSICKRLVELLGGKIGVTSVRGEGSRFWFELPLSVVQEEQPKALPSPPSVPKFPGKRVLLAEDHPVNQIVACDFLEEFDVEVQIAGNGLEVLQAIQERQYDLILMDCQMPEMDGFEATTAVRHMELETGRRMPIIAVTANAMAGDREYCLSKGMDDYLSKPYDLESLSAVLSKWLLNQSGHSKKMIDSGSLLERFKREQAKRLLNTFVNDTEQRLEKMMDAAARNEFDAIAHDAHALKGAASLISLNEVKQSCSDLQSACLENASNRVNMCLQTLNEQLQLTRTETEDLFKD